MADSSSLAEKSVHAAVAAIEIYNKPDFKYREEAFSLLMCNAWELLLKAKWLLDHNDDLSTLYETEVDPSDSTQRRAKLNRCGNPITFGATYLAGKLLEDANSGFGKKCDENLKGLIEIRDNAAHFMNKDLNFGRRVLEFGTASLQNYLRLVTEWFSFDLSRYNFFLMPLSFYHGFESVVAASVANYSAQESRLLSYLEGLDADVDDEESDDDVGAVTMRIKTTLTRGKGDDAFAFRWTDDENAPTLSISEEDVLKNYTLDYKRLTAQLRRRYRDFVENMEYHRIRKSLESEKKYCIERLLDPGNPKSSKKRFYNNNILTEFDKHYTKRKKT
ncbi:MAG TPA: DUF3644 domain-containing protein [Pirellulaceae bacterium]|nr:DUF3644 domain-containing protein [Pirellulaceae bacterium]